MANDPIDVLIIGAGASSAAMAWSLAETRMRIVCLEQGDWMNSAEYPSSGRDWESRTFGDFSVSPNRRNRPTDYPVNDSESPISVANFNAVGGCPFHIPSCSQRFPLRCTIILSQWIL